MYPACQRVALKKSVRHIYYKYIGMPGKVVEIHGTDETAEIRASYG